MIFMPYNLWFIIQIKTSYWPTAGSQNLKNKTKLTMVEKLYKKNNILIDFLLVLLVIKRYYRNIYN